MTFDTLDDLYLEQLEDLRSAEDQLVQSLPKMAMAAHSEELRQALRDHLDQTRIHLDRVNQALGRRGRAVSQPVRCEAMEGLIREAAHVLDAHGDPNVKDAAIIAAAQRAEHYEIAGYGTLVTYARQLGREQDADELAETLEEEKEADARLSRLAEGSLLGSQGINERAAERDEQVQERRL
jgi:ferritin-like metal-binding protein YciE